MRPHHAALLALSLALPAHAAIQYSHTIGGPGTGAGQFVRPIGLALDNNANVFVTDFGATLAEAGSNNIELFTAAGTHLLTFGSPGTGPGQFQSPGGIAVGVDGRRYVADVGNTRVQVFTAANAFSFAFGSGGTGTGQFSDLTGVAVDPAGNIYTAEAGMDRIQKFDPAGNHLLTIGTGVEGAANNQFRNPIDLVTDPAGNLYVADAFNQRIQKFSPTGDYLATIVVGPTTGDRPTGIALDVLGNLYVTLDKSAIAKFSPAGDLLETFGSPGSGPGQFSTPRGIDVDADFNIYVADNFNKRVQVLSQAVPEPASLALLGLAAPALLRRWRG